MTRSAAQASSTRLRQCGGCLAAVLVAISLISRPLSALAQSAVFQLDPNQSYLQVVPASWGSASIPTSGTTFGTTLGVIEQSTGSLRTGLSGSIKGSIAGSTLSIVPGSELIALPNPQAPFLPSTAVTGSPGMVDNFGGLGVFKTAFGYFTLGNGDIALRDAEATIVGGSITIGSAAPSLEFSITSGILDFDLGYPVDPETGYSDLPLVLPTTLNDSSTAVTGSFASTIRIPYKLTFAFDLIDEGDPNEDSRLVMEGMIVATRVAASAPGDFTGDGSVNGLDLAEWKAAFGETAEADGDGDGDSDGRDFLIWQRALGTSLVAVVPEPASFALAVIALLSLRSRPVRFMRGR